MVFTLDLIASDTSITSRGNYSKSMDTSKLESVLGYLPFIRNWGQIVFINLNYNPLVFSRINFNSNHCVEKKNVSIQTQLI